MDLAKDIENSSGPEGYRLTITPDHVHLNANTREGIFRGIQTLRQLAHAAPPTGDERTRVLECIEIVDRPRFSWRGFMLDVARHFFEKDIVLRLIDAMEILKMNVLHLHLVDDQGWRMPIDQYPELIEVGSRRRASHVGGFLSKKNDATPHEGHFTKEELKAIAAHASARHVRLVPEIELPGHSMAALAAKPGLSCSGGPFEVPWRAGIKKDVYCAGKD